VDGDGTAPGVVVRVSQALRPHLRGLTEVRSRGATLDEVLSHLEVGFPGLRAAVVCQQQLRRFVNAYIDGQDLPGSEPLATRVQEGQTIDLVVAVAGG
jgi:hypothetical protein